MNIPFDIDSNETLVRFIFADNFKNKKTENGRLIEEEIFLDTRLVGISLQRAVFSTENFCKERAKIIETKANKIFIGFITFKKSDFLQAFNDYKLERPLFDSRIEFTPLDTNDLYLIDRSKSTTNDKGNPSHADLLYINPAMELSEPTPKTTLRLFSRKLFKYCKLLIDSTPVEKTYKGSSFI